MIGRTSFGTLLGALSLLAGPGAPSLLQAQTPYRVSPAVTAPGGPSGMEMVELNGVLYFDGVVGGRALYRSDGTEAGTFMVKNVAVQDMVVMGNALYFGAGELWTSDGTTAGTVQVKDIRPGIPESDPTHLFVVGNTLYFTANDGTNGNELWKSDGTEAGTVMVKDIFAGSSPSSPSMFTNIGDIVYFAATCSGCGASLYRTDGTESGTTRVGNVRDIRELVNANGTLFMSGTDLTPPNFGFELWRSDGATATLVKDIRPAGASSGVNFVAALGNRVVFAANDGVNGEELWQSDGSEGGTTLVQPLVPGNNLQGTGPGHIRNVGGTVYFMLNDGVHGRELWKYDGTSVGMVKDINPGPGHALGSGNINGPGLMYHDCLFLGWRQPRCTATADAVGLVFFYANDGVTGDEPWTTDGTEAGTMRLQDLFPGAERSHRTRTGFLRGAERLWFAARSEIVIGADDSRLFAIPITPQFLAVDAAAAEDGGSITVTVQLALASGNTVTVAYATVDGTALAGSDYVATSGSLTFAPGVTAQTLSVPLLADAVPEASEHFIVRLSNSSGPGISRPDGRAQILNDDGPTLAIADTTTAGEGGFATFTLTLSAASANTVTVDWTTSDGTATAGPDYDAAADTVTFAPGTTSRTVIVALNDDAVDEPNETFFVNLSSPAYASIGDGQGQGTITDDDPLPALSINNASVAEGNTGSVPATFTVSLSAASTLPVAVEYATADGTAAGGSDYTAASGTLSFAPGTTSLQVVVAVLGDTVDEGNETFVVDLSNASNATIADGQGQGTINDNDTAALSVNNVAVAEGNVGTVDANFTATLSLASSATVTVDYATADVTATAGADYSATTGTLTFAPGTTSQTVTVPVLGDLLDELLSETFNLNLSNPVGATITDGLGLGTITDDDPAPSLSVDDATVTEGNTGTVDAVFTVSLSAASGQIVRVNRATANQTATAGSDYVALPSAQLTFAPGTTSQTVTVVVNGDTLGETNETFALNLSAPVAATIADNQGVGTITNDDASGLSVNNVAVTEGNTGTLNATFAVTLNPPATGTVTVDYATADVTATAGSDYTATSGTLTFAAGVTTLPVAVPVIGDTLDEANETFNLDLSNPSGATLTDAQGVGTINDNDTASLAVNNVTVTEGNSGTVDAVFAVTLSVAPTQTVTVNYATADQTATAGADYVAASGTLTFNPGQTSQPVTVVVNGDTEVEGNHTFVVNLSGATGATIGDAQGVGTITDDETAPTLSVDDVTVAEGNAGTVDAVFTVTLSFASTSTVTVSRATANLTATAGTDYVALPNAVLSFAAGETSKTVTVTVNGDTLFELDETFRLNLTGPVGATLGDGQGQGTIRNDDGTFLYTLQPCRVADTRGLNGPSGGPALVANNTRNFPVTGRCLIPATAKAVVVNVVAVNPGGLGNFRLYPFGGALPTASVLNFAQGRTRANNAIIALGTNGQITVRNDTPGTTATTHFVLDVFGYFE